MDPLVIGAIVVTVCTLLAVGGMLIVRAAVDLDTLESFHDVAGHMLQVIGTLYAVLLGFVVVDAMGNLNAARVTVESEANAVANVFFLSAGFPDKVRTAVQANAKQYVDWVLDEEWDAMSHSSYSKKAVLSMHNLWEEVVKYKPVDAGEQNVHQQALQELSLLGDCRRKRLIASTHGVSPILWTVLIAGGFFTVVFTYFFGLKRINSQGLMTGIVAAIISLNVFLVYIFGYPFSGSYKVEPAGFKADRLIFIYKEKGMSAVPESGQANLKEMIEDAGRKDGDD